MTCIVGIIDKETGKITIGGDSAGIGGYNRTIRKDKKVFIRGNFIIGFTTSFRMGQLLMTDDRFEVRDKNEGENDFHFMVNAFIPAVQKLFKEGGFLEINKDVQNGGTFLVGYNGHLYKIDSDFQICESIKEYQACGCGEDFALGSLYSTEETGISVEQRIKMALEAAEAFSTGVARPFNLVGL